MIKCAGYIRVSTADQATHGLSLQAQRDLLTRYAADHDMDLVEVYADEGVSAAKALEKRTEILRLVSDAEAGKFSVILFKDITRWSRNAAQYYKVQERLDKCKVGWIAVEQPYLETVTPTGKFQVSVMLGTAQLEADQTGQRIKFTQEAEIARGYFPFPAHNAPLGYTTQKVDGHNRLVIDPETKDAVISIYDEFLKTGNATQTGKKLGIPHFNLLRTIRNPIYKGEFRGNLHFCEPIIAPEKWETAQAISTHKSYTPNKHYYVFSGITFCGLCGAKMKWNTPDDKYPMCRCETCRNTLTQRQMEQQVIEQIEPELNRYRLVLKKAAKPKENRKSIENRLLRLNDLYIDGMIDRADYDKRRTELQDALKEPPAPPEMPVHWRTMYDELTTQQKNVLWKSTKARFFVKDKHVSIAFDSTKVLAERMSMSLEQ